MAMRHLKNYSSQQNYIHKQLAPRTTKQLLLVKEKLYFIAILFNTIQLK